MNCARFSNCDMIWKMKTDNERILVPLSLRKGLLKKAHEGQPGIVRFKGKLRELYWWPGMDTESERFVRNLSAMQRF